MTDMSRSGEGTAVRVGAGWGWLLVYGIASVLLGLLAFAWPFSATLAATLVIGSLFVVAGVLSVVAGASGRGREGRGYSIGFGLLSLVVGIMLLARPIAGALSLTLVVAIWLAVRGLMEIAFGMKLRRHKAMWIALGIVNLLLAVVILATVPFSALTLPGYVLGVSFLFGGATAIAGALAHRTGASAFAVPS